MHTIIQGIRTQEILYCFLVLSLRSSFAKSVYYRGHEIRGSTHKINIKICKTMRSHVMGEFLHEGEFQSAAFRALFSPFPSTR